MKKILGFVALFVLALASASTASVSLYEGHNGYISSDVLPSAHVFTTPYNSDVIYSLPFRDRTQVRHVYVETAEPVVRTRNEVIVVHERPRVHHYDYPTRIVLRSGRYY